MSIQALPFKEAVQKAARQNFERDVKMEICSSDEWVDLQSIYEEEAEAVLLATGENYLPEFNEPHIVLERTNS